ncbi:hypothetical protein LAD77_00865 [Klebsiella pneumoniae]|nr:hypothetical protein [Klebsiella pneumoniae]
MNNCSLGAISGFFDFMRAIMADEGCYSDATGKPEEDYLPRGDGSSGFCFCLTQYAAATITVTWIRLLAPQDRVVGRVLYSTQ